MDRFQELAGLSNGELETLLRRGRAPDPESLAGWEFRGFNRPWWASLLGIRRFVKGFFASDSGLEGYNRSSPESPHRFGFYSVVKAPAPYAQALLLDYGASTRNPWFRPERLLRDFLVQPDPNDPDILLGKAYLDLGAWVPSNFFILQRFRKTDWKP